jgi:hypothetical protein
MYEQVEKPKENKSQSVSNGISQMQSSGGSTFQFVDNRPEAIAQRKLQEMANNSHQAKQVTQLQAMAESHSAQQQNPIQKKENNTGLPDNLKSGIENLSGYSMDDVKVHYNSDKPVQLQAHAYAQGTDIHLASGQEKHLPHEVWHVVQQKQGRVYPTTQLKGKVNINDDSGLEKEADAMGAKVQSISSAADTINSVSKESSSTSDTVQKITIALGDLQEAEHSKKKLSESEHAHAKIITDAEESRRKVSNEDQAHPWDERFRPFNSGPLGNINNENIRIYGHGASYIGDNVVSKVGGYSATEIVTRLIKMGLPTSYTGEIYLTGCETAIGPNKGFLRTFYTAVINHCAGATVRGNLGTTTTDKDGEQGVWTGVISQDSYNSTRDALTAKKEHYLSKNAEKQAKTAELIKLNTAINAEKEVLLAGQPSSSEVDDFLAKIVKFDLACKANEKAVLEISEYMNIITKAIQELDDIAYDKTGRLSVTLPAALNEQTNIDKALDEAKKANEYRLTKLEIAEELAFMYGWAESVVTKKLYGGDFDERAKGRIASRTEPTPSYIG